MNPSDIDALIASAQAAKAAGGSPGTKLTPISSATVPPPGASYDPAEDDAFAELGAGTHDDGEVPMSMLLDLTLPVSIELGRTSMTVQEILRLGRGSVIQLERLAGEPIDIYVGDRRFAEGEVVVLGEHFGVRITRILARSRAKAQHA
jgi:flagellar motor switch protein FliN/FliY